MNVERLYRILLDIQKEYIDSDLIATLSNIRNTLQSQVSAPAEPTYQTNFVAAKENLYGILDQSPVNNFSPGWKQILKEIGGEDLFGSGLKRVISEILSENQITPAAALTKINTVLTQSENFKSWVDSVVNGLKNLRIQSEELKGGQCELGYSIPRAYVHSKLKQLNKEIWEINFILNNISEAVTGEKQDYEVRTISSTDYMLFIEIGLRVGKVLSSAIKEILSTYKTILEIKKLRNEMSGKGVPETKTEGIEEHANSLMEAEIKKIVSGIMKEMPKSIDTGRRNELSVGVTFSLNKIANRIDNGFNFDVRVGLLPTSEATEQTPEETEKYEDIEVIKSNSKDMEFINTTGQPILQLPEKIEGDTSEDEHENSA